MSEFVFSEAKLGFGSKLVNLYSWASSDILGGHCCDAQRPLSGQTEKRTETPGDIEASQPACSGGEKMVTVLTANLLCVWPGSE